MTQHNEECIEQSQETGTPTARLDAYITGACQRHGQSLICLGFLGCSISRRTALRMCCCEAPQMFRKVWKKILPLKMVGGHWAASLYFLMILTQFCPEFLNWSPLQLAPSPHISYMQCVCASEQLVHWAAKPPWAYIAPWGEEGTLLCSKIESLNFSFLKAIQLSFHFLKQPQLNLSRYAPRTENMQSRWRLSPFHAWAARP